MGDVPSSCTFRLFWLVIEKKQFLLQQVRFTGKALRGAEPQGGLPASHSSLLMTFLPKITRCCICSNFFR